MLSSYPKSAHLFPIQARASRREMRANSPEEDVDVRRKRCLSTSFLPSRNPVGLQALAACVVVQPHGELDPCFRRGDGGTASHEAAGSPVDDENRDGHVQKPRPRAKIMRMMRMPPQRCRASPSEGLECRKAFWGRILSVQKPNLRGRGHKRPVSQGPFVRRALRAIAPALAALSCMGPSCYNPLRA